MENQTKMQNEGSFRLSENALRKRLARRGCRLLSRRDCYGDRRFTIANENRVIIAGEFLLSFDEIVEWAKEEFDWNN